jgi:hypothetical protein
MRDHRGAIDEGGEHEAEQRQRYEILKSVHGAWREDAPGADPRP